MVYQSYQDPNLDRNLRMGFWLFRNRYQMYKIGIGILITLTTLIWLFVIISGVKLYSATQSEQVMLAALGAQRISTQEIHQSFAPKDLILGPTEVVASASQQGGAGQRVSAADFFTFVENENEQWSAEVQYKYVWGGGASLEKTVHLLPLEQSILPVFGATVTTLPNDAIVEVTSLQWRRVRDQEMLHIARNARGSLSIAESDITPSSQSTVVQYSVENSGVYTLIDPTFAIVLTRLGGTPVALAQQKVPTLEANTIVEIEERWLHVLPSSAEIMLYPLLDFLNIENYRKPSGEPIRL